MSILSSPTAARPPSRKNSSDNDQQIILVDHTKPQDGEEDAQDTSGAEDQPGSPRKAPDAPLSLRTTRESLREELTRRKYAKWQQRKVVNIGNDSDGITRTDTIQTEDVPVSEDQTESLDSRIIARSRDRIKGLLRGSKTFTASTDHEDAVVDVLYENQRGYFLFGIPLFSQKSLLNLDPSPWVTGEFKASAVDITNAQVPDPSWEWAWRSWYVDMSLDVDEEGWQYSFSFKSGFSWHGTHPWFHSFVRRRRWLRKRVRHHQDGRLDRSRKQASQGHNLNADYFTIHSPSDKGSSKNFESSVLASKSAAKFGPKDDDEPFEDIRDIASLMKRLKKAKIDRERIVAVRYFLRYGGDEIRYLSEYMHTIMSLFIFQNSRRQLLALLIRESESASSQREEHAQRGKNESADEQKRIDNVLQAVKAAEEQVKKLEFWSDVRDLTRDGQLYEVAEFKDEWEHNWQVQDTSEPAPVGKYGHEPGGGEDDDRASKASVRDQFPGGPETPAFRDDKDDDLVDDEVSEHEDRSDDDRQKTVDKGKGKAREE